MRDLAGLLLHLAATIAKLRSHGGTPSIVAESLLMGRQLLILSRSRDRAPNLRTSDRIMAGFCALPMRRGRVLRSAIVLKPSTILGFRRALVKRKYRLLFKPVRRGKPGPRGPSRELMEAIVSMKQRNPDWGCPGIAQQVSLAFGVAVDNFVGRLIGTIRGECRDESLFWNALELERKLMDFKDYYNRYRRHGSLHGVTPAMRAEIVKNNVVDLRNHRWRSHCRGLYQTPTVA